MNSLRSLGWWFTYLPSVIDEVKITNDAKETIESLWRNIVSSSDDGIKRVSHVCEVYDKWLEAGMPLDYATIWAEYSNEEKPMHESDPQESYPCWNLYLNIVSATRESSEEDRIYLIRAVRTLLLGLKKWKFDDNDTRRHRRSACISGFCSRQGSDLAVQRDLRAGRLGAILALAKDIIADVLRDFEDYLIESRLRIGPGAVEEGWSPLQKWGRLSSGSWYWSPLLDIRDETGYPKGIGECPREELGEARLVAVPKDRWRDRVISVEPNAFVMCQMMSRQAMLLCMARHPCTRHLRPDRQDWQQEAAIRGASNSIRASSRDEASQSEMALHGPPKVVNGTSQMLFNRESTLDFTDASDMITYELVSYLFPAHVMAALASCRSFSVSVEENGKTISIPLRSYAGMGNATTFVVETLVFWAVTYAQLALFRGLKSPEEALRASRLAAQVKVYGDDLIVPADLCVYSKLLTTYSDLGWKLNTSKSFYRIDGSFRESCGVHAFQGEEVTPIRFCGYDAKSHTDQVALADKIRQIAELYPRLALHLFNSSQLPNTHIVGNLTGRPCLNQFDWPERTPLPVKWNSRYQLLEIKCTHAIPLQEEHKRGFSELLLASLCGYHYCGSYVKYDTSREAKRQYGSEGRRLSLLCYRAPIPRRVRIAQGWFPTTPWGADLSTVGLR